MVRGIGLRSGGVRGMEEGWGMIPVGECVFLCSWSGFNVLLVSCLRALWWFSWVCFRGGLGCAVAEIQCVRLQTLGVYRSGHLMCTDADISSVSLYP